MGSASSVLNDPKGHLLHSSWPSRMQGAEAANIAPGVQGHSMAPAALLALWGWQKGDEPWVCSLVVGFSSQLYALGSRAAGPLQRLGPYRSRNPRAELLSWYKG